MADAELSSLRTQLVAARTETVAAAAALPTLEQRAASTAASLTKAQKQAATLRQQLDQLRATDPGSTQIPILEEQLKAAEASVARAQATADKARLALEVGLQRDAAARAALAALEAQYHPRAEALLTALAPTLPILLLPVRLETRFAPRAGGGTDLLVRIYPDDVAEDAHQPALTAEETAWGQDFAKQAGAAAAAAADEVERAWIRLAQRFGPGRAAWIARQATSGASLAAGSPAAWARASLARALPDSWLVMGYRGGRREITARGAPILAPLSTGLAPDSTRRRTLPDSGIEVDDGMRWMVEFEEAVRVGMGVRIPLTVDQAAQGLDLLMVLGVRVSLNEQESSIELTALLDAHHYTWGLSVVPQGTPTNNTDDGTAGYAAREADLEARHRLERGPALCAPGDGSDGALLAARLGIGTDVVAHLAHANQGDQRDAGQMLDAVWPATWAYFVEEMLHPLLLHLSGMGFDLERARAWAVRYVRARGPLPALRAGSQPYGVLPVTSLDRWHATELLPEVILFHVLNPPGDNVGQYRISWDMKPTGEPGEWGQPINVPGWFGWENQGGAVAAFDLDGTGRVDLFVAHVDNPGGENTGYYRVGQNLEAYDPVRRGTAAGGWRDPIPIPGWFGAETRGMGIAVTRLPGRARPALVVHHVDHPDVRVASGPEAMRLRTSGQLLVFARGRDGALYQKRNDGQWGNWERIDAELVALDPAAAASVVGRGEDRVDLFARRPRSGALWQRTLTRGTWSKWVSLGGALASGPAVSSWATDRLDVSANRLDVFARGTAGDLQHVWRELEREWSAWESLGGAIASDPAAVSWGSGRIDVFGRGTDDALQHKWFDAAAGWSAWESLGGVLTSGPGVCSWGPGRLDVFVRGTDGTLYHKWFERVWSDWEGLGGTPASDPTAVSSGVGRLDVFATDADGRLLHLAYADGRWQPWEPLTDRERAYYRVGFDLDSAGNVSGGWTNPVALPGVFEGAVQGGGIAVGDVNGNGTPDLVAFHLEQTAAGTRGSYRIGWNLGAAGQVSSWSAPVAVPWTLLGPPGGADVAIADFTESGQPDLLVHYVENRGGDWFGNLRIGYDLDANGVPARWSDSLNAALGPLGQPVAGVGIAVAHIGRAAPGPPTSATWFVNWLAGLRGTWRRSIANVPRVGFPGDPPNLRLVRMLGMEALSTAFAARSMFGGRFVDRLFTVTGQPLDGAWRTSHDALTAPGRAALQPAAGGDARLSGGAFAQRPAELYGPLVQAGPPSETEGVDPKHNYIAWLVAASPKQLHDHALPAGFTRESLLYLVLRQALLWEYARAAYVVQPPPPTPPPPAPRDPELVDIPEGTTLTPWRQLLKSMGAAYNNQTIGDYLYALARTNPAHPHVARVARVRQTLTYLSALPTGALERLLCEALDLSTHRLDAWITAVATERLDWVRDATPRPAWEPPRKPAGLTLGGYGWVEDLRPAAAVASGGYVHAPSLAHATTAAILRSGYLAHAGGAGDSALAIDLSSARVRAAVSLLDGVREGQPLGALLGYRFERGLHENHGTLQLDKYVRRFRELVPLTARKLTPSTAPAESVAASNVVDGLALVRRWQRGKASNPPVWDTTTIPFGTKNFPAVTTATGGALTTAQKEYLALARELDLLEEALDAVSDAVTAESVYHVVQGSPLRAGASLDAVSRGEVPPPELELARSPRTGIGLTQRLVTLFEGDVAANDSFVAAWDPGTAAQRALQVRAAAEPQLNAWAARLLGDPARVSCRVEYVDATTGVPTESPVTLADLALSPLDVIYAAAEVEAAPRSGVGQGSVYFPARSEIEERIRLYAIASLSGGEPVQLVYDRDMSWTPDDVSFPELLEVARRVRDLVTGARALEPRDLAQPKDARQTTVVLDDATLRARADAAVQALDDTNSALDVLAKQSAPDVDTLRDALVALAYFGVQGALPQMMTGTTAEVRTTLKAQATRLVADLKPRVAALRAAETAFGRVSATAAQQRDHDVERLHGVFGDEFRVVARFRPYAARDFAAALNGSTALLGSDPLAAIPWLQRAAPVRAGAARLETTLLCAEAIGGGDALQLQVAQLPREAGEPWVGLSGPVKGGRLSIVAHTPGHSASFDATRWLSGLLVDEWVEVVPSAEETTAVTFHYDAPGAAAPQSLLLAVPPDVRKPWGVDTIEAILLETFELAKLRLVDLEALGEVGHYFPGLYFAFNAVGDTISADFAATAGSPPVMQP